MEDFTQLNDALLSAEAEDDEQKEPKRNTKDSLISKIVKLHEEQEVPLMYSNTKLRRMTKEQLCKLLAEKIENRVAKLKALYKASLLRAAEARAAAEGREKDCARDDVHNANSEFWACSTIHI